MSSSSSFLRVVASALIRDPPVSLMTPHDTSPGCAVHRCECQHFIGMEAQPQAQAHRHRGDPTVPLSSQCGACGHAAMYHTKRSTMRAATSRAAPCQSELADALDRAGRVEKVVEMKLSKYHHASQRFDLRDSFVGSSAVSSLRDAFKMSLKTLEELSQARLRLSGPHVDEEDSATHHLRDESMHVMRRFMKVCEYAQVEIQRIEASRGDVGRQMSPPEASSGARCPNCEELMDAHGKFCANCGYCSLAATSAR